MTDREPFFVALRKMLEAWGNALDRVDDCLKLGERTDAGPQAVGMSYQSGARWQARGAGLETAHDLMVNALINAGVWDVSCEAFEQQAGDLSDKAADQLQRMNEVFQKAHRLGVG